MAFQSQAVVSQFSAVMVVGRQGMDGQCFPIQYDWFNAALFSHARIEFTCDD